MFYNSPSISFNGLKINGTVSSKNLKKLSNFTGATENQGFIEHLEKNYKTDMVLNNSLSEISFLHEKYGDLTKYDCPKFPVKDFFSQVVKAVDDIKSAIKKAEKHCEHERKENNSIKRGC